MNGEYGVASEQPPSLQEIVSERWPVPADGQFPDYVRTTALLYGSFAEDVYALARERHELETQKHFLQITDVLYDEQVAAIDAALMDVKRSGFTRDIQAVRRLGADYRKRPGY